MRYSDLTTVSTGQESRLRSNHTTTPLCPSHASATSKCSPEPERLPDSKTLRKATVSPKETEEEGGSRQGLLSNVLK